PFSVGAAAAPIRGAFARHQLRSSDAKVRRQALSYLLDERDSIGSGAVIECLKAETEPKIIELAAYTLARLRDRSGIEAIQIRAEREADSYLKARLIQLAG